MKQGTHFTASAYIVYKDTVILHRHKKFNLIIPVGGYLEGEELPEEAVVREAKEETGLDITLYNPCPTGLDDENWKQANGGMCLAKIETKAGVIQYDFTYFATVSDISLLGTGEMTRDSFMLVNKKELADLEVIAPNVLHYATKALYILGEK